MLTATLRWRDEFKVTEAIKEEFPEDVFGKLGYVYGKDKSGGPVACVCLFFFAFGISDVDDV
jgi:phosphatidylinositol transfer protein SFH5